MSFVGEIIDLPDLIQLSGELEEFFLDIIGRPWLFWLYGEPEEFRW